MKLSMNVKFDMIFELHCGFIVHARSENYNLCSQVVLHIALTTASIACNRIDRLRCHQNSAFQESGGGVFLVELS